MNQTKITTYTYKKLNNKNDAKNKNKGNTRTHILTSLYIFFPHPSQSQSTFLITNSSIFLSLFLSSLFVDAVLL